MSPAQYEPLLQLFIQRLCPHSIDCVFAVNACFHFFSFSIGSCSSLLSITMGLLCNGERRKADVAFGPDMNGPCGPERINGEVCLMAALIYPCRELCYCNPHGALCSFPCVIRSGNDWQRLQFMGGGGGGNKFKVFEGTFS